MAMSDDELLRIVLNMIQVTPGNYKKLNAGIILYLCEVVAEAEKQLKGKPSIFDGLTAEQIKERMAP
jgi:hypothetical protein